MARIMMCLGRRKNMQKTTSPLPRISAARLEEATPAVCPDGPVLAAEAAVKPPPSPEPALPDKQRQAAADAPAQTDDTLLYLAYGSNMAAATFQGVRGIRPLACVSVSVPTLQLVFDLPGVPYLEPCFANTAVRRRVPKIPDKPPTLPPVPMPDPPAPPGGPAVPPPATRRTKEGKDIRGRNNARAAAHGDPVWTGDMYAVVYEVTAADFATILATEGGGGSYQDVLVPCMALPPAITIPEKPPLPDPPRPFLAHTLWAPQQLSGGKDGKDGKDSKDGNDDDNDTPWLRRRWQALRRRFLRLALTGVRRPDGAYAQPSRRYLQLLVDGAREHELPPAYQAWLAVLAAYHITTARQRAGQMLLLLLVLLPLAVGMAAILLWSRKIQRGGTGRLPLAVLAVMHLSQRFTWGLYDAVFKPVFGDGERTIVADDVRWLATKAAVDQDEDGEDAYPVLTRRRSRLRWARGLSTETKLSRWHSDETV